MHILARRAMIGYDGILFVPFRRPKSMCWQSPFEHAQNHHGTVGTPESFREIIRRAQPKNGVLQLSSVLRQDDYSLIMKINLRQLHPA